MNKDKIGNIQAIFLILMTMISHIILNLPNIILSTSSSAAPLNVIYITFLALIFFLIVNKFFEHFKNMDILDISEYVGGKIFKAIISLIFIIHLIFISGILITAFCETLKTIYLQNMPIELLSLIFILIALISNQYSFKNIARTNAILMPLILFTIIIIFIAILADFIPQRIFPILGYGINETFILGTTNIFAFGELLLLYLIRTNLQNPNAAKKIGIISILLSGFFLFLSVTSLLLLYPFVTGGEGVLSIYMVTRNIQFGKFFQRIDALFILIWVITLFSYISVVLAYILKIAQKNIKSQKNTPIVYIISICIFIVTLVPQNIYQIRFAENVIYKYSSLIIVFGLSFVILFLGYLKKKKENTLKLNKGVNNVS